ncbi:DUF5715 family protein [Empedobacter stercoris]|uniref:DUF5715 family protein n=1 Tax=Empedobacter TaxID=59734 RepID=UPI001662894E|nr:MULTISPECIES: DUF5715 family protein [Empedobacter]HJD86797.1 DUF5715 family protein [Empedobacter falsenii]MCA4781446.1 hypothetical protein [Empedobacter stercoris]MCA4808245.1 hypothetical protein [Empedobacter stercoris]MDM1522779.1 hypothetical protein [Empedobacter sp. 225-1]MDM1542839.1 hypothetical protein [Empedobacter sp. 189-2]
MKQFLIAFFVSYSFIGYAQKRVVIEPSKEYVQHLNAAKSHKLDLIDGDKMLNKYINQGKLVKIKQRGYGWRVGDLTHSHSYLVPKGRDILSSIARDFVKTTGQNFFVVTSMTRTLHDQNRLRGINKNASSNDSSHNFGAAFDISYVRFNHKISSNAKLEKELEQILKTYVKLGKIYYVKESKIKCYHIIVRNY